MKVAEGNVDDSPFARTIFSLAANRFTGDLVLTKSRREYRSSWENGQLVAAVSPSPADSPGRVALANGLVNSTSLGMIVERIAAEPERSDVEIVAEFAELNPKQSVTLKHRVLARKAARIFALPGADFVVNNARSMRADPELPPLDVRWLIYFGLRTHYSIDRLKKELAAVGDRGITLPAAAAQMMPAFGFGELEQQVLHRLQSQELSIDNLVYELPGVDTATTISLVYALMACGYLAYGGPQASRVPENDANEPAAQPKRVIAKREGQSVSVSTVHAKATTNEEPAEAEAEAAATNTRALIAEKVKLLESEPTHYKLLDIGDESTDKMIRDGYFHLAKKLHPDHLQALGIDDLVEDVQRLFAAINNAFAILSNSKERDKYREILAAGGAKAYAKKRKEAEDLAMRALRAEEHYSIGHMALRRDHFSQAAKEFKVASELTPGEAEYQALYAWAFLCSSPSVAVREENATEAMGIMDAAVLMGEKNENVLLYNAKMLKLLGRNKEAKEAFSRTVNSYPKNREAALELRILSED